jgi:archaemetzincin
MEPIDGPPLTEAVDLVLLGALPLGAPELAARLSRRLHVPCRIARDLDVKPVLLADRAQGDADALLRGLEERALPGRVALGLTALDLAIPIFTFVFGRARQGGRAALVSLARLDPTFYGLPEDAALLAHRTVLEMLHELGHVASLPHCREAACLMSFAGSVERVDVRGQDFCPACAKSLPAWLGGRAG